jgi:hypothetical protein
MHGLVHPKFPFLLTSLFSSPVAWVAIFALSILVMADETRAPWVVHTFIFTVS